MYTTIHRYTGQFTFSKVPKKHVELVTLYLKPFSICSITSLNPLWYQEEAEEQFHEISVENSTNLQYKVGGLKQMENRSK